MGVFERCQSCRNRVWVNTVIKKKRVGKDMLEWLRDWYFNWWLPKWYYTKCNYTSQKEEEEQEQE